MSSVAFSCTASTASSARIKPANRPSSSTTGRSLTLNRLINWSASSSSAEADTAVRSRSIMSATVELGRARANLTGLTVPTRTPSWLTTGSELTSSAASPIRRRRSRAMGTVALSRKAGISGSIQPASGAVLVAQQCLNGNGGRHCIYGFEPPIALQEIQHFRSRSGIRQIQNCR